MNDKLVANDWWPEWLQDVAAENPLAGSTVVLAEIQPTHNDAERYFQLFTGLVPPDKLAAVLEAHGGIGHEVDASGPHPAEYRGRWDYSPRFWIQAGGIVPEGLEPVVVSWQSSNQTVLCPDNGFLMTYGLIPRIVGSGTDQSVHWDDPSVPRRDIVVVKPVSVYAFPVHSGARVSVDQDFVQDYATIREQALALLREL